MDRKTYNADYEYDLRAIAKRMERRQRKEAAAEAAREERYAPSGLDPIGEAINKAERLKGLSPHQRKQLPKYRRGMAKMKAGGGYA